MHRSQAKDDAPPLHVQPICGIEQPAPEKLPTAQLIVKIMPRRGMKLFYAEGTKEQRVHQQPASSRKSGTRSVSSQGRPSTPKWPFAAVGA